MKRAFSVSGQFRKMLSELIRHIRPRKPSQRTLSGDILEEKSHVMAFVPADTLSLEKEAWFCKLDRLRSSKSRTACPNRDTIAIEEHIWEDMDDLVGKGAVLKRGKTPRWSGHLGRQRRMDFPPVTCDGIAHSLRRRPEREEADLIQAMRNSNCKSLQIILIHEGRLPKV